MVPRPPSGDAIGRVKKPALPALAIEGQPLSSGQQTAKKAIEILLRSGNGFHLPTATARRHLLIAFAERNLVVYGKAFDIIKLSRPVDMEELDAVRANFDAITVYEIKSTRKNLGDDFRGYFFSLSGAEMLVALVDGDVRQSAASTRRGASRSEQAVIYNEGL